MYALATLINLYLFLNDSFGFFDRLTRLLTEHPELYNSVTTGLVTGLISSFAITYYYRHKDNKRDAMIFCRNWVNNISDISHLLVAIDFAADQAKDKTIDYDSYFEKLLSIYRSRPLYEERYNVLPEVKKNYSEYKLICNQLEAKLNEYNRSMNVLLAYKGDRLGMEEEERANRIRLEQQKRYSTVVSLISINVDLLLLKRNISEKEFTDFH